MAVILAFLLMASSSAAAQETTAPREVPVEVFQVLDLPITITDTVLVKSRNGYVLKCSISNSSEFRQLGLKYSLVVIDSMNVKVVTRNEGFKLAPYQTRSMSFKTPMRLSMNGDERIVLMLEQVVSTDYIWEVVQPKDSLAAYVAGDYSVTPRVMRVSNQVDAPVRPPRVIY